MSGNLDGFDASQVDPATDFEAIPAGDYLAMAVSSEFKPTKAGTGEYLEITFEVIDGQFRGRRLWARLNLKNPNEQATKIAQAELSSLCRAVGVLRPKDSSELHGKAMVIKVTCEPRNDKPGTFSNAVKNYSPTSGGSTVSAPQPAQPQQMQQPSVPPWKRKSA